MDQGPRICFCTTVKGRTKHLRETLPKNLTDNYFYDNCKFVVLDYNSQDDLLEYLKSNYQGAIEDGYLAVYSYKEPGAFRMAHAKNMAHRCGILEGADILVNLDADNFTGEGFAEFIDEQFDSAENPFLWSRMIPGVLKRGISGRIAVTKDWFLKAGGYAEKYEAYGPDDKDFTARLQRFGLTPIEVEPLFLEAIHHGPKLRYKEYPHARSANEDSVEEIDSQTTIANFGNFGCGKVYKNFSATPIVLAPLPTRIFGIGFQKTATTSLDLALRTLGHDSAHWKNPRWAKSICDELWVGRSPTMERYYAVSDFPIAIFFKKLDSLYPGSKFILTTRNEEAWLKSVRNHWSYERNPFRESWDRDCFSHRMHRIAYGRKQFDAEIFLARYREHNADVREYFKGRPGDLLTMDMDSAGWPELCGFLGNPVPQVPYPREFPTAKGVEQL